MNSNTRKNRLQTEYLPKLYHNDSKLQKHRSESESKRKRLDNNRFVEQVKSLRKSYQNLYRFHKIKHSERANSSKKIQSVEQINRFTVKSGHFLDPTKIITVTADKWAIFDYYSGKYIRGYRAHDINELSVFSKILVFMTINAIIEKDQLDISRFQTIVTQSVIKLRPSIYQHKQTQSTASHSGKLKIDDIVSLEDLLHLVVLQQSQQYEIIAAANIGAYLLKKRQKEYFSVYDASDKKFLINLKQFYDFVEKYRQQLQLQNICYVEYEPRFRKQFNKCSAFDVGKISIQCLKVPLFQKMIRNKSKSINVKFIDLHGQLSNRQFTIFNKTIDNPHMSYYNVCRNWRCNKQFKTSLASVMYEEPETQLRPIVVVLMGSYSGQDREKDIQQIIEWYIKSYCEKMKVIQEQLKLRNQNNEQDEELDQQDIYETTVELIHNENTLKNQSIPWKQQKKLAATYHPNFLTNSKLHSNQRLQNGQLPIILEQKLRMTDPDEKGRKTRAKFNTQASEL